MLGACTAFGLRLAARDKAISVSVIGVRMTRDPNVEG